MNKFRETPGSLEAGSEGGGKSTSMSAHDSHLYSAYTTSCTLMTFASVLRFATPRLPQAASYILLTAVSRGEGSSERAAWLRMCSVPAQQKAS